MWLWARPAERGTTNERKTMSESIISFARVNKWYGNNFHVLRDIDLQVAQGERLVICGPSEIGRAHV